MLFQAELQTGDEASTCIGSTSPVPSSSYPTTDVTTEPSDCATTTSSTCKVNITIDYPVTCGVAELLKLRCNGCELDHHGQLKHDCLLPDDIVIDMDFDEDVKKVNSTSVIRDWLTLLLEVDLTQADVAPEQLNAINSWLEEYPSELSRNNVKLMVLAALKDDL